MFRRLVLACLAMLAAGFVSVANAQGSGDWVLLGTREVDFVRDVDTIDVSKARGAYNALRLVNKRGDVVINNVEVRYGGGRVHNERRSINLLEGERTRPIDPSTEDRFVDTVTMFYKSNPAARAKGVIEVWGRQSSRGAGLARPASVVVTPAPSAPPVTTGPIAAAPTPPKATTAAPGTLTAGGDVLFGVQSVGFGVDRDVIRVGAEVGKFDKVRLRVLDNDIFINDLTVVYANGEKDTLAVNAEVKKDTRTRWFNLKGDRFIKEIQMTYKSRPNFRGQARIEVFGEYAEGWLAPGGEGSKYNQGWVLLGAQTAGFVGFDRDTIPVGRNQGGFRKLRVTVKERAITLNELRVIYSAGPEDVIPIKTKVEAGATYGPIDLKGGTRGIEKIEARYRSRFLDKSAVGKGAAIVELWGQH
jgi:hypothetical protein